MDTISMGDLHQTDDLRVLDVLVQFRFRRHELIMSRLT